MPKSPTNVTKNVTKDVSEFKRLIEVVQRLRGPNGCPWDREQTHESLTQYAIEEAHELAEAIDSGERAHLVEELGDLLFQVALHSEIARQNGKFRMHEVISHLNEKMIRRHPHVFGNVKVRDSEEVIQNWQKIKETEKKGKKNTRLDTGIPVTLPALIKSQKIGQRTRKQNFDWNSPNQVWAKVTEEMGELKTALRGKSRAAIEEELGDVLFSLAQLARHLDMDAEQTLRKANSRFVQRFQKMLALAGSSTDWSQLPATKKEKLWKMAKKKK